MWKLSLKFLSGILFIPIAIGSTKAFYNNLLCVTELAKSLSLFLCGITCYVILHLIFYKPTFMYILGHEAVHAATAWILGKKVKSFKVTKNGGSVTTDSSNIFIELSPYFIPVYVLIILMIYFVVSASYNISSATFVFFIGFTLAFHVVMTVEVLKVRQPDIVKSGYIFSIILIYSLNLIVISLIFGLLFPEFELKKYFVDFFNISRGIYLAAWRQLFL